MRELSVFEMDHVTGGNLAFLTPSTGSSLAARGGAESTSSTNTATGVATLVVTGRKNVTSGPNLFWTNQGLFWDDPNDTGAPDIVYELSALDLPMVCPTAPTTAAETQAKVDGMAAQITRMILNQTDHTTREYAAIIYKGSDNLIHSTMVMHGESDSVGWDMNGITSYSQILAVIHSHPINGHNPVGAWADQNKHPSLIMYDESNQPYGDTITFNEFVNKGVNASIFLNYIIGPDDELRKYTSSQMTTGVITAAMDKTLPVCGTVSA